MTLIDKDAALNALNNCTRGLWNNMRILPHSEALEAINALPVKYPFNPDWPPDEAIRETIRERDDALKEVTRLTSRLALAERVMRNLAKVLCSPRYDRTDGKTPEQILAAYGWTKEDAE